MREEDKNTKGGKDGYLRSVFFFSFLCFDGHCRVSGETRNLPPCSCFGDKSGRKNFHDATQDRVVMRQNIGLRYRCSMRHGKCRGTTEKEVARSSIFAKRFSKLPFSAIFI